MGQNNQKTINEIGARLWNLQEQQGIDFRIIFPNIWKEYSEANRGELVKILDIFDNLESYNDTSAEIEKKKRNSCSPQPRGIYIGALMLYRD